jgi:hypothetical protein
VPRIEQKISGGVHGDVATASITVNSIPNDIAAAPGLRPMRDLALPSWFGGRSAARPSSLRIGIRKWGVRKWGSPISGSTAGFAIKSRNPSYKRSVAVRQGLLGV